MNTSKINISKGLRIYAQRTDDSARMTRGMGLPKLELSPEEANQFIMAYEAQLNAAPACDPTDCHISLYDLRHFTTTIIANEKMPTLAKRMLPILNSWREKGCDEVCVEGESNENYGGLVLDKCGPHSATHPFFTHHAEALIVALRVAAETGNHTAIPPVMQCVREGIADHDHIADLLRNLSDSIAVVHPDHAIALKEISQMPGDQIRAIFGTLGDALHPNP